MSTDQSKGKIIKQIYQEIDTARKLLAIACKKAIELELKVLDSKCESVSKSVDKVEDLYDNNDPQNFPVDLLNGHLAQLRIIVKYLKHFLQQFGLE